MSELFLRLDKLRIDRGLTLVDLGRIVGASPQNVQRWKNGGTIMPDHIDKLAKHFGVTVDWLMRGELHPNAKLSDDAVHWKQKAEELERKLSSIKGVVRNLADCIKRLEEML